MFEGNRAMKTSHKIIIGDARQMEEVVSESVHLVVTSPPYWQLKDYGHKDQIGFNDSYEDYVNNLNLVWQECYRILHPGCRLCINIGDQFARSVYYGRYKVIPIRTEITKFCETIGFDYMGAIIWRKVTTTNTTGGATIMGSFPYPRNGIIKIDYEFILIFKKLGPPPRPTKEARELSKLTITEWNEYFSGHWNFGGEKQDRHLAMFPEELPKRLIRMFTFVGDTVVDPFLGSGTTSLAARNLARNSIGYEINPKFLPHIESKLGIDSLGLGSSDIDFQIIIKKQAPVDYSGRIGRLSYIFKDRVQFDKKIDPKSLNFGSQIDGEQRDREEFFSVTRVLSPEIVELNSGVLIRLLGVKTRPSREKKAIEFLRRVTAKQPIFLKYDAVKFDDQNRLLVYMYLKNKTFLNAHLIKLGLVEVDQTIDFSHKPRFLQLSATSHNEVESH